eukprot:g24404.t2
MVNLQCRFDGVVVRSLFALATPVVPLMMLMACAGLECWAPSYGISVALQVLTIFFIGGASGSSKLFNCQRFDGGKVSLGDYAFHPVFPHLLCSETTGEAAWVRGVGTTTAIGYGIIVPAFLAFLLLKQHVAMRPSRTFFAKLKRAHGSTILQIHSIKEIEPQKGVIVAKRLMAAAAAHVAVHVKGEVQLELQDEDVHDGAALEDDFSIPDWGDKIDKLVLRQHSLMQMLTERILLEDLKDAEFDRALIGGGGLQLSMALLCGLNNAQPNRQSSGVLVGAKRLLCKYATFRDVWMEVLLKLVAAALVSVVSTKDGLMLSVALMLGMAIIIGVMSPYARPQINTLQSLCFTCLAVSAVGFYQHYKWLSRMALALPFLLLPVQALRPDSAETLALRIYQELENNIDVILKGEPVKVSKYFSEALARELRASVVFLDFLAEQMLVSLLLLYSEAQFHFSAIYLACELLLVGVSASLSLLWVVPKLQKQMGDLKLMRVGMLANTFSVALFRVIWQPWQAFLPPLGCLLSFAVFPTANCLAASASGGGAVAQGVISSARTLAEGLSPVLFGGLFQAPVLKSDVGLGDELAKALEVADDRGYT